MMLHRHMRDSFFLLSNILSAETLAEGKDYGDCLRKVACYARGVALAHDSLVMREGAGRVDMKPYVRKLLRHLRQASGPRGGKVKVSARVELESLEFAAAVPCGLIISELYLNSVRHAFVEASTGAIGIVMEQLGDAKCLLEMIDDGIGIDAALPARRGPASGMQLVHALVRRLGGNIRFDGRSGTRCKIVFRGS